MIAVCRTFMVKNVHIERATALQRLCLRQDVTARVAILRRWTEPVSPTQTAEFANCEVAVNTPEMMIHLADLFTKETGLAVPFEEWKPKQ